MKNILRSVWPELIMVAIMAVLALGFMSPVFQGKILYQTDIVQAKNMANEVEKYQKQTGNIPDGPILLSQECHHIR